MNPSMLKRPSACIPLVMSFLALATVLFHVAVFGIARETDEGTAAHIFQLLIAGQVPVVAFFAIKWLSRDPTDALTVLALQVGAAFAAFAPVFFFDL
jgi:hypothetical protein